jgi:hypothetical protein
MRRMFFFITLVVVLIWVAIAVAGPHKLKGDYAYTGEVTCLWSTGGFDANFRPISGSLYWISSGSAQGIRTFHRDGTGTVHNTIMVGITHPPGPPSTSAGASEYSYDFTYTIGPDGSISTKVLPNSFKGTVLTGPATGQTFTQTPFSLSGMVSEDRKTLTLTSEPPPEVVTQTSENGSVVYHICHRWAVNILLEE